MNNGRPFPEAAYIYKIICFYGDEEDDYEIKYRRGYIAPIRLDTEPYEAVIRAEGESFHILSGTQSDGDGFLCIPDWHAGCRLTDWADIAETTHELLGEYELLGYENSIAIASALPTLWRLIVKYREEKARIQKRRAKGCAPVKGTSSAPRA